MSLKEKIATVLDLLADADGVFPEAPAQPVSTDDPITKFAATYREVTGEELSPALRTQLEENDALRDALMKVSSRTPGPPTPLGEATDHASADDESRPESKVAAERAAYDRFAQRIVEIGQR